MRIGYKISFPDGEYKDHVFNDWFQLCAHLMGKKKRMVERIVIYLVILMG